MFSDWLPITGIGAITSGIITDATTSGSTTHVFSATGNYHLQNISGGPFTNGSISTWLKGNNSAIEHQLMLRSQNNNFSGTYYMAGITQQIATVGTQFYRVSNGVAAAIGASNSVAIAAGNTRNIWMYWSFACTNEISGVRLVSMLQTVSGVLKTGHYYYDIGTTQISGSGTARFGHTNSAHAASWDDVAISGIS